MSQPPVPPGQAWWRNDGNGGNKGDVVAHTTDPSRYHTPDDQQMSRMGLGAKGIMGTVIARARADGSSMGFKHNEAGVVHVDPDAPGGGFLLDPKRMNNENTRRAMAVVGNEVGFGRDTDNQTYAVAQMLGAGVNDAIAQGYDAPVAAQVGVKTASHHQAEQPGFNPHMPNAYVAPRANGNGDQQPPPQQYQEQVGPELDAPEPSYMSPEPPQVQPAPPMAKEAAAMSQPQQPGTAGFTPAQLSQLQHLAAMMGIVPGATFTPPVPAFQAAPPQQEPPRYTPPAPQAPQAQQQRVQIPSIKLPYLEGPPTKPTRQVMFDLGTAGGNSVKYHDVIEGDGGVILVYDTRYEEGVQYAPPVTGKNLITLSLPKEKKTYRVFSMGFTFSVGCLDCVMMILPGDTEAASPDDQDQGQ